MQIPLGEGNMYTVLPESGIYLIAEIAFNKLHNEGFG